MQIFGLIRRRAVIAATVGVALFSIVGCLIGCGANRFSTAPQGVSTAASISSTAGLAECNNISVSTFSLLGQVSTFYDPTSHQLVPSYITVNFTTTPSQLLTSSTVQIQLFRFSETSAGVKTYNSVQTNFYFLDRLTAVASPFYNAITLANIKSAITTMNMPSTINVNNFFERVYLVYIGVDASYDGATFAYYDTSISSTAQAQGSVLLPPFYVNPNTYALYKPVSDLESLHPFISYLGSSATDSDFESLDNEICQTMATGTRIPASIGDESGGSAQEKLLARAHASLASMKGFEVTPLGARVSPPVGLWATLNAAWLQVVEFIKHIF